MILLILRRGIIFLSFFLLCFFHSISQNLVPNADFEEYFICPNAIELFDGYIKNWYNPTSEYPSYFNSCSTSEICSVPNNLYGYNYARSGSGYASIIAYSITQERSYISVKLKNNLSNGVTYCVGFYLNLSNGNNFIYANKGSRFATNKLGLFFSDTIIHINTGYVIPISPNLIFFKDIFFKDTLNWMMCYAQYTANGGEQFITIGNFDDDSNTNLLQVSNSNSWGTLYYIDDAFLYKCSDVATAEAGENIHVCKGDSVKIGMQTMEGYKYKWLPSAGLSNDTIGNPYAKPQQTTTYYLYLNKYIETKDSVTVYVDDCSIEEYFHVYPSLSLEILYLDYGNIEMNNTHLEIFDICGRKIKDVPLIAPSSKIEVNISKLAQGMYVYGLVINNGISYTGKIVVERGE